MLTPPSERLLHHLLCLTLSSELSIDSARLSLCRLPYFSLFSLHRHISLPSQSSFSATRLKDFATDLGVEVSERDARAAVRQFDSRGTGQIEVEDLAQMVLPATDQAVRRKVLDRPCGQISYPILVSLRLLLSLEFAYQREFRSVLLSLAQQSDFSLISCFSVLADPKIDRITTNSMSVFMRKHGTETDFVEIDAIFRRIDNGGTEEIPFESFELLFLDSFDQLKPGKIPKNPSFNTELVDIIGNFFESLIISMRKRDISRLNLRNCADFDLNFAFFPFDPTNKGYSTIPEFQSALISLGVNANFNDISTLFARFSGNTLNFRTFSRLILPESTENRQIGSKTNQKFTVLTKSLLGDIWITHLFDSKCCLDVRKSLISVTEPEIRSLYELLDRNSDGKVCEFDVFFN